jgi:hypothetical protein
MRSRPTVALPCCELCRAILLVASTRMPSLDVPSRTRSQRYGPQKSRLQGSSRVGDAHVADIC